MNSELFIKILGIIFMCFIAFVIIAPIVRITINSFGSAKAVKAVVEKKYIAESFSKYSPDGTTKKYMVVFSIEGKTKSFQVSEFSYDGYQVNEKGLLTYKGNQLIKFE